MGIPCVFLVNLHWELNGFGVEIGGNLHWKLGDFAVQIGCICTAKFCAGLRIFFDETP